MKKEEISKYYLLALIFLIILLAFLIIKPFIKEILIGIIISYIFYPIYKKINKRLNSTLSALIICCLVILLVTLPLVFIINTVYNEASKVFVEYKEKTPLTDIAGRCKQNNGLFCNILAKSEEILSNQKYKGLFLDVIQKFRTQILGRASEIILLIPKFLFDIFIVFFIIFYLLKDGKKLYEWVITVLPIKKSHQDILLKSFNDVTYAVVYGHVVVAIIQGIIGTIGFIIFKLPSPILLGSIMTIFALIPYLGAGVVWLPAGLIIILNGFLLQENSIIIRGVLLLLYGAFIISTIDNILRPKIIGARADIHPIIVLLGVIGGISLFGFVGIVIGPVILAACSVMIRIYLTQN